MKPREAVDQEGSTHQDSEVEKLVFEGGTLLNEGAEAGVVVSEKEMEGIAVEEANELF